MCSSNFGSGNFFDVQLMVSLVTSLFPNECHQTTLFLIPIDHTTSLPKIFKDETPKKITHHDRDL